MLFLSFLCLTAQSRSGSIKQLLIVDKQKTSFLCIYVCVWVCVCVHKFWLAGVLLWLGYFLESTTKLLMCSDQVLCKAHSKTLLFPKDFVWKNRGIMEVKSE